ncbi:MAG: tyrosine--tRNA ligase [Deltaproteobacteria bacterium]|nr:tyrosine--tRNA ligase [Deltaproteobacteria bacterium]MBW1959282.1 tyrosine--tRNA ligase [Deltaproteobacteria bacterium]MBW2089521.1 tyrosine--tRNA ligase [Deltaproteobacteria bacterium]MBW2320888.1 tyrosine--tRNA ligase [Deltaproteobacteria bacterium]
MLNLIDILKKRGFIDQTTHENELDEYLETGQVTCYIGFDPTASSLHVGSLVPIMSLAHMQRHGHRPIALIGGGTGLVGDPSGKTEMRQLLTPEMVDENATGIKKQLSRFIDFSDDKALMLNNADWLAQLEYIPFLRDVGRHFSVNRMIKAESYKMRLESEEGLNFIEFNYMLLQAYDFLELYDHYGCRLQMGGSDQWGNIVAGVELIRRVRQETVFGITFPLITTSSGAKMGKTAEGAVWLDPDKTSPYEYYQYWVNTDDRDVIRFMALFTFLPIEEIKMLEKLSGADLNSAKVVLAFEATQIAHGMEEAINAYHAAARMFGDRVVSKDIMPSSSVPRNGSEDEKISMRSDSNWPRLKGEENITESIPHSYMEEDRFEEGIPVFKLYHMVGLASSGSAARRLIEQGGAYVNGKRIESFDYLLTNSDIIDLEILLRAGKKRYHKIKIIKNKS